MVERRLSKNLISLRHFFKISQSCLAQKSGVSLANIGYIENMRNSPSIRLLEKIAIALNMDICQLISRPDIQFPKTGIKTHELKPYLLAQGEASFAFWTEENGMEFHPISNNSIQNALYMMALLQANGITGYDLLDKSKALHIPYDSL